MTAILSESVLLPLRQSRDVSVPIWPMILEKALVKSMGGYQKLFLSTTQTHGFIRDFTNSPSYKVALNDPKFLTLIKQALEKKELVYFEIKGIPMIVDEVDEQTVLFKCTFALDKLVDSNLVHDLEKDIYFMSFTDICRACDLE
jgi:hypothetical protein